MFPSHRRVVTEGHDVTAFTAALKVLYMLDLPLDIIVQHFKKHAPFTHRKWVFFTFDHHIQ